MKAKLILFILHTKTYNWLLQHVLPKIRFSWTYAKIDGHDFTKFNRNLVMGDIVLISDYRKLTSILIGGPFSHALLYCGANRFAEMTAKGFGIISSFDVCKEADRVAVIRCKDFDYDYSTRVVGKCLEFSNKLYDNKFTLGVEALYCSEMIYQADFEKRLKVNLADFAGIGQPYISPLGLYSAENGELIYDSGI